MSATPRMTASPRAESLEFDVDAVPPFRLEFAVWVLRRRPENLVDRWDGETYRRVLIVDGTAVDVAVRQVGGAHEPRLSMCKASDPVRRNASSRSRRTSFNGRWASTSISPISNASHGPMPTCARHTIRWDETDTFPELVREHGQRGCVPTVEPGGWDHAARTSVRSIWTCATERARSICVSAT